MEGNETAKRDKLMDAVKGLAALFVVMGHVIQVGKFNDFNCFTHPIFVAIYSFHMPLFMFVSGFITYYKFKPKESTTIFLKGKFLSLIIPFLTWATINYFLNTSLAMMNPETFNGYIANAILYPGTYPALWFLWVLFFCLVLLSFSVKLEKFLNLFAYPIVWGLIMFIPYSDYYSIYMIKWMFPFCFMGYLINRYKDKFKKKLKFMQIVAFVAFPICLYFWDSSDYIFMTKMNIINNSVWSTMLYWCYIYATAIFGIINTYTIAKWLKETFAFKIICELGLYSMDVYILESFFLMQFSKLHNIENGYIFNFVYIPVATIVVTLACYLCGKFILRRNKHIRKLLLGSR